MSKNTNISWHQSSITKEKRREQNNHHSFVIWFTGLSGSGKSTIANALARRLYEHGVKNYVLDGDNIRYGLNRDLGFSNEDRTENIRRIGEVAKLFVDSGQVVLTAFISPFQSDRKIVRDLLGEHEFFEVYVKCPLEDCEKRDPKGLYEKARKGIIPEFTGISSPYEEPAAPEIIIESNKWTVEECVDQLLNYFTSKNIVLGGM
ncbi:adenylyl-sulfate kinase [Schinkia sp. CFF1]